MRTEPEFQVGDRVREPEGDEPFTGTVVEIEWTQFMDVRTGQLVDKWGWVYWTRMDYDQGSMLPMGFLRRA